ncbi:MAG: WG repeat-containing protein [Candidatus Methanofastidiosa archaeon]|nr:WG repeat-containing protein [Candidatus Methanofastidiosa archaeon]
MREYLKNNRSALSFLFIIVIVVFVNIFPRTDVPIINWLVPPQFDSAYRFSDNYGVIERGGTLYLVDKHGKFQIIENYDLSMNPKDTVEIIPPCAYAAEGSIALVSRKDHKWHYLRTCDLSEIPGAWEYATPFNGGIAVVANKENKYYTLAPHGKILFELPPCDEFGQKYQERMLRAKSGGKWGFINSEGKWAIPAKYDGCWNFSKGIAWVLDNDQWLALKKDGSVITSIPTKNGEISWAKGARAIIESEAEWSLFDAYNGYLFTKRGIVQSIIDMNEPFCASRESGLWHYVGIDGREISKEEYEHAEPFYNGYAVIERENKYGVINKNGRLVVPIVLEGAGIAAEDIIPASVKGKWGYIKLN